MYTEPSIPFYMALSIYVPLVLIAYLIVFLALSAIIGGLKRFVSLVSKHVPEEPEAKGLGMTPRPTKA